MPHHAPRRMARKGSGKPPCQPGLYVPNRPHLDGTRTGGKHQASPRHVHRRGLLQVAVWGRIDPVAALLFGRKTGGPSNA